MNGLAAALVVLVVVGGGVVGAIIYAVRQQGGDDADAAEVAAAEAGVDAAADDATPDPGTDEAEEPTRSTVGQLAGTVAAAIPETDKGVVETAREEVATRGRPEKEYALLGRVAAGIIAAIPKPLLSIRGTLFKRLAVKSIENYHKVAGGDAVAINAKAGQQLDLEPVAYKAPEECEEGQQPGWRVKGREKAWHPAKEGNSVNYLGRAPVVALEDDAHVEAGWLAPRVGEAIEMDNYWPLFTDPEITAHIDYGGGAGARNGAVADGGTGAMQFELEDFGEYAGDAIVDLDSGPGYDGMRISMSKAREWQAETVPSEQMQMQEERGRLMGLLNGDNGPGAFKLLLLAGGIILGALFIIEVLPILLNGGGGGGGGINPLLIGGW